MITSPLSVESVKLSSLNPKPSFTRNTLSLITTSENLPRVEWNIPRPSPESPTNNSTASSYPAKLIRVSSETNIFQVRSSFTKGYLPNLELPTIWTGYSCALTVTGIEVLNLYSNHGQGLLARN